jgi:polyhydroxybutyrate depolymerase
VVSVGRASRTRRGVVALVLLPVLAACTHAPVQLDTTPAAYGLPRLSDRTLNVGGLGRSFLLHVPPQPPHNLLGRTRPFPLVIVLHGSGAEGATVRAQSQMDVVADDRSFVVAYPDGTAGWLGDIQADWNLGKGCCRYAGLHDVNDVAFIRAIIADVASRLPVDPRRIYVAGFSDGATMTSRVGCELADQVAAIGIVAGEPPYVPCHPARPIPVIAFHGTADDEVPYLSDAASVTPPAPFPTHAPPPEVRFWAATDRCGRPAEQRVSSHVMRMRYRSCPADSVVELYTVTGGGHAWPGGEPDGPGGKKPTKEISATELMVDFFEHHVLTTSSLTARPAGVSSERTDQR